MDSSGSPSPDHSWLAFSLSNQYYHPPQTTPPPHHHPISHQQQQQLTFFQHNPHLFAPPTSQPVVDNNGASSSTRHQANNNLELSFLGGSSGGGMLQVGWFPTAAAAAEGVTIASVSDGGGGVYKAMVAPINMLGDIEQHQQQQQAIVAHQVQSERQVVDANNKQQLGIVANASSSSRKVVEGFGQRTSIYRGVTRHRWTGRYEAHLWDNSCRREGQSRKGRQVYLGGYDKEEKAARAYDLAALKYWGPTTTTNFPICDYEKELEEMKNMSRQEFVASLRRKSSGFSRGASIYRGVTRHHQHGRWQARIGRVAGNKDLYLGTFSTQEEAAEAYDIAAIKFRGLNAVTNFDISRYDVKSIITSNLPVGGLSNKTSKSLPDHEDIRALETIKPETLPLIPAPPESSISPTVNHNFIGIPIKQDLVSQNYNWAALGQENNETLGLEYDFGYVQQPPPHNVGGGGVNEGEYSGYEGSSNNNENGREVNGGSSMSNSWIVSPSLQPLQSPKQNVTGVQTPIFGIE